tara:strand:- start:522919 stop:523797 length:879 start_codon:yes stop_codon:yes gene_type:complete
MSGNVASFDEFSSDRQIAAHAAGLPRIVLEGQDDVWLFKSIWFPDHLARFDFLPADDVVRGAGCTAVPHAVEHSRTVDGIPAFGIVDRDVYFREKDWNALYESDDTAFPANKSEGVFVSRLWEVEAHLLQPDLLESWVMGCATNPAASGRAIERSLEQCDALFEAAPYFAAMHHDGVKSEESFASVDAAKVREICDRRLEDLSGEAKGHAADVAALVDQIRSLAPTPLPERLLWFLRFIDTKRLLARLRQDLKLDDHRHPHRVLAALMSSAARKPDEFAEHLERLAAETASA